VRAAGLAEKGQPSLGISRLTTGRQLTSPQEKEVRQQRTPLPQLLQARSRVPAGC